MTDKKVRQKRKTGMVRLILASLIISFFILYVLAIGLWAMYGYEKAFSFFIHLLKTNLISMTSLDDTVFSLPLLGDFKQKASALWQDAHLADKAQTLTNKGGHSLKEGLSGFLSEALVSDALEKGTSFLNSAYVFVLKAGLLFILAFKIFFIKAFLLIAAIPLFFLLGVVGLIDGLSQREIRRSELGRESSYLFHMLNKWIARIIGIGLCAWVCMPAAVNPQWFFVPLGLLFSMMLSLSASKFKKYL